MPDLIWDEMKRLRQLAEEHRDDRLLELALEGREKNVENAKKLYGFVVQKFGQLGMTRGRPDLDSAMTKKFHEAVGEYLAATGLPKKEIESILKPGQVPGDADFVSVLGEFGE